MDILSRAVGPERAPIAFEAFSQTPSVSIRLNPYKLLFDQKGLRGSTDPNDRASVASLDGETTATLGT